MKLMERMKTVTFLSWPCRFFALRIHFCTVLKFQHIHLKNKTKKNPLCTTAQRSLSREKYLVASLYSKCGCPTNIYTVCLHLRNPFCAPSSPFAFSLFSTMPSCALRKQSLNRSNLTLKCQGVYYINIARADFGELLYHVEVFFPLPSPLSLLCSQGCFSFTKGQVRKGYGACVNSDESLSRMNYARVCRLAFSGGK